MYYWFYSGKSQVWKGYLNDISKGSEGADVWLPLGRIDLGMTVHSEKVKL